MPQISSVLMLLVLVEELVFFGVIWQQPSAGWHLFFVVGMLLTAAALLSTWAAEYWRASTERMVQLALPMTTGTISLLVMIPLFHYIQPSRNIWDAAEEKILRHNEACVSRAPRTSERMRYHGTTST